ncbi:hypothetical protein CONLIGDRAFT_645289 [Coniochaeta ligniaria NRRL 30616]|uniref:Uncharacterized protein n=1 Tax=Coniochaeta ligniaria NRRL 30616 TaxID=1408157 RepID=A0A1J7JIP5_9PEZI|nr:hypothetical protein CONLIGDRAFT_645289 [Coniochaeta ligniaria NRRL 30616]
MSKFVQGAFTNPCTCVSLWTFAVWALNDVCGRLWLHGTQPVTRRGDWTMHETKAKGTNTLVRNQLELSKLWCELASYEKPCYRISTPLINNDMSWQHDCDRHEVSRPDQRLSLIVPCTTSIRAALSEPPPSFQTAKLWVLCYPLINESVATSWTHETGAWPLDMHNYDLQQLLACAR